jgi:hypothetical protein
MMSFLSDSSCHLMHLRHALCAILLFNCCKPHFKLRFSTVNTCIYFSVENETTNRTHVRNLQHKTYSV